MSQNIFKNPFVSSAPTLTGGSVGNGTLTIDRLTHFTINQTYTVICSAIAPFTVFNVVGNLDGAVGVAIVGQQFTDEDNKIFITIQQGPTLFQVGDTFEFSVAQGTDLNQQNLDAYDEIPQKNFGVGITGQNKGDHNVRFSLNPVAAFKTIGDLLYTAKQVGPDGNAISIEYIEGSLLTAASLTIQSLTFTANTPGSSGNDISIEYRNFIPGTFAKAVIQDIEYIADQMGTAGNDISIQYVGGGVAGSEVVTVNGTAITVQIQDGVSTSDDIELAIGLHSQASLLVDTTGLGETGLEPQFIDGPIFLTGGTDQTGDSVTVVGNVIIVQFESGATTAQQVKDLIDANTAALGLITTTITGAAGTVQTAPVAQTFLTGGADDVGTPGNEIVQVIDKEIKISFVDGLSTGSMIKTKIEESAAANALISVTNLVTGGTTYQSSPVARTFLSGGRASGSFSFNTAELTSPGQFFEGNAPVLMNGITNQGDELTLGESINKGKVTLDDDISSNVSGPKVENTQKTINNLIQNNKILLVTADNSKVKWLQPNLTFEADILFVFPETGFLNRIPVASSPLSILDGQHAYVIINRLASVNVTVTIASTIPEGENVVRLFSRRGNDLVWYDNTLQRDKKIIRIGEGGGGGTAFQEKIGSGDGVITSFPLTFIPSNEFSILIICSHVRENVTEYNYNPTGNKIDFVEAPAAGQDVYAFYLTEGDTLDVPTPDGLLNSYVHTITADQATLKEFPLQNTPAEPAKILVDTMTGGPQEFNVDFTVQMGVFRWSGYALDGVLAAGDKVRLFYYS